MPIEPTVDEEDVQLVSAVTIASQILMHELQYGSTRGAVKAWRQMTRAVRMLRKRWTV